MYFRTEESRIKHFSTELDRLLPPTESNNIVLVVSGKHLSKLHLTTDLKVQAEAWHLEFVAHLQ